MPGLFAVFENKEFQNIALCHFNTTFSTCLLLPVMPVFLSGKGFSETQIGLIMGTAALASVMVRPWIGTQVDRFGSRPIIMWGQVLFLLSIVGLLWADGIIQFVTLRFVYGIAMALYGTGSVTYASSIGTGETNASAIAMYTLMTTIGLGVSTSLSQVAYDNYGMTLIVLVDSILIGSAFCIMQFRARLMPLSYSENRSTGFISVMKDKNVLATSVGMFGSSFAFGAMYTYIPLAAIQNHIAFYSFFFIAFAVSMAGSRIFVQRIVGGVGLENTCLYGYISIWIGVLFLISPMSPFVLVASGFFYGAGLGVVFPAFILLLVQRIDAANRGTSLGILIAASDIANALSVSVLGGIAEHFGFFYLFLSIAVILSMCLFVVYGFIPVRKKAQPAPTAP